MLGIRRVMSISYTVTNTLLLVDICIARAEGARLGHNKVCRRDIFRCKELCSEKTVNRGRAICRYLLVKIQKS
jgi:hypothetical protein